MRSAMLLVGLALLCATVHAELPCVSPSDAVLVMEAAEFGILMSPGPEVIGKGTQITCPSGKRVGLWLIGAAPVLLRPMKIVGCEVGVVVDVRRQVLEDSSIVGARVGVCWQGDEGYMEAMTIEASEIGMIVSGKNGYFIRSRILVTSPEGGIKIQFQEEAACTCAGAV